MAPFFMPISGLMIYKPDFYFERGNPEISDWGNFLTLKDSVLISKVRNESIKITARIFRKIKLQNQKGPEQSGPFWFKIKIALKELSAVNLVQNTSQPDAGLQQAVLYCTKVLVRIFIA